MSNATHLNTRSKSRAATENSAHSWMFILSARVKILMKVMVSAGNLLDIQNMTHQNRVIKSSKLAPKSKEALSLTKHASVPLQCNICVSHFWICAAKALATNSQLVTSIWHKWVSNTQHTPRSSHYNHEQLNTHCFNLTVRIVHISHAAVCNLVMVFLSDFLLE